VWAAAASGSDIAAAKFAGPDDTLAAYRAYLDQDPPATGRGTIFKRAILVQKRGNLWVDATLYESELPEFYTRYLATSKDGNRCPVHLFSAQIPIR